MKISVFLMAVCWFSGASIVDFSGPNTRKFSVSGREIVIYPTARIHSRNQELKLSGAGLRDKTIVLVSANVYVLASYSDVPPKEFLANPLKSIASGQMELLQLTLLRDLSAEKIQDSFKSALEANSVALETPAMKKIFSNLNKPFKEGSQFTILSEKKQGTETVTFDGMGMNFSVSAPGLGTDFWKIWYGKPADSGLERLQEQLLKG